VVLSSPTEPQPVSLAHRAVWLSLLLALAAWWVANPYRAFDQDALYYAAEALFRAGLADLSADPFFRHGSQGDFSLFITPYAALIRAVGVDVAALAVTVLGRVLWLWAAARLARALAPSWAAAGLGLALLLWLPNSYEPYRLLSLGEAFAVPRLWAEAACMLALADLVACRHARALWLALLGCGLHPLMGAGALVLVLLLWPLPGRLAALSAMSLLTRLTVAALALALLAAAGLAPFDRLLLRYDPAWWQIVGTRNFFTVTASWGVGDVALVAAWWLLLGWSAWRHPAGSAPRRLGVGLCVVVAAGLLAWVLACALQAVLGVQVQLWRVLWLLHVVVPLLVVAALARRPLRDPAEQASALLALAVLLTATWSALVLALLLIGLSVPWPALQGHLPPARQRRLAGLLLALVLLARLAALPELQQTARSLGSAAQPWLQALTMEPAAGLLLTAGLWAALRQPVLQRPLALRGLTALAVLLLGSAAWAWGQPALARLQRSPAWVVPLRAALPPGQTVYWRHGLDRTWLDLRRPHYAHPMQGASALFSRPQALELQRRLLRLQAAGLTEGPPEWPEFPTQQPLDARTARWLCEDPALDLVLLEGRWPQATRQLQLEPGQAWSIFECADRRRPQQGAPS
jgi:hypothetical protein